jgi:hypothetical protein
MLHQTPEGSLLDTEITAGLVSKALANFYAILQYYSKEFINAYGKVDYDFNNDKLYRSELSLRYNPTRNLGLSVEYLHREPRVDQLIRQPGQCPSHGLPPGLFRQGS